MVKILDCTFRDGGYYTNWDFPENVVKSYWRSISSSRVDFVEVGFRNPVADIYRGLHYYSMNDWASSLGLPKSREKLSVGVMINGSAFKHEDDFIDKQNLDVCFPGRDSDFASFVRVAVNCQQWELGLALCEYLHSKGYLCGLNLMQIHRVSSDDISVVLDKINRVKCLSFLYFADSFGNLNPSDIKAITQLFVSRVENVLVGFHSHDNTGRALQNCLAAAEAGIDILDGTICGMGRGAGNVTTEALLINFRSLDELSSNGNSWGGTIGLFQSLKKKYGWGSSIFYEYAALNDIHPTFVQYLLTDPRYASVDLFKVLKTLGNDKASEFDAEKISLIALSDTGRKKADYDQDIKKSQYSSISKNIEQLFTDKKILILGTGESSRQYSKDLIKWACHNDAFIIVLNEVLEDFNLELQVTALFNETRASLQVLANSSISHQVVMPDYLIGNQVFESLQAGHNTLFAVACSISEGVFKATSDLVVVPYDLTLAFAIAIAIKAGRREIFFAGCDGFESRDPRQRELLELMSLITAKYPDVALISLTPTTLPFHQSSPYAPYVDRRVKQPKCAVIIPARYKSSRLEGKPLKKIGEKTMIQIVWELSVEAVGAKNVYVATDSEEIAEVVANFGGKICLTSGAALTGTDRVAEAALGLVDVDFFINVQGDEPFMAPANIKKVLNELTANPFEVVNGFCELGASEDVSSFTIPKVVIGEDGYLRYMSRSPIPCSKEGLLPEAKSYKKQVCVYGFSRENLEKYSSVQGKSALEEVEDIEVLRFLDLGVPVKMVELAPTFTSVDTAEDLLMANKEWVRINGSKNE